METIGTPQTKIKRQIWEYQEMVKYGEKGLLLNRRGEWGQNLPPKLTLDTQEQAPTRKRMGAQMPIQKDPDGSGAPPRSKRTKVAQDTPEVPPIGGHLQEQDAQDQEQGDGVQETAEATHGPEAAPLPKVEQEGQTPRTTKIWTSKEMLQYMRNGKQTSTKKSTKSAKLSHRRAPNYTQRKIINFLQSIQPLGEPRGQTGSDASSARQRLHIGVAEQAEQQFRTARSAKLEEPRL